MKSYLSESIIAAVLIIIAALLWNPYWMPMGAVYAVLVTFIIILGVFIAFIWRERGGDEREVLIRQIAARIGYIILVSVLAVGIIWQTLVTHVMDPWLVGALIGGLLAKTLGFVYGKGKY